MLRFFLVHLNEGVKKKMFYVLVVQKNFHPLLQLSIQPFTDEIRWVGYFFSPSPPTPTSFLTFTCQRRAQH